MRKAVAHKRSDDVAVAVVDLMPGEEVEVSILEGGEPLRIKVNEPIPLGHKVALREIPQGKMVIEYGEPIGKATKFVAEGRHVHIHNLRSLRWDFGGRE